MHVHTIHTSMVYTNLLCIRGFARFGGVLLRGIVLSRSLPLAVDDFSEGLAPLLSGALQKSAVRFYLCQGSSLACLLCGGFLPPPLYQPLGHSLTPSFVLSFFRDLLPFLHTLVINDLITLAGVLFFFKMFSFSRLTGAGFSTPSSTPRRHGLRASRGWRSWTGLTGAE